MKNKQYFKRILISSILFILLSASTNLIITRQEPVNKDSTCLDSLFLLSICYADDETTTDNDQQNSTISDPKQGDKSCSNGICTLEGHKNDNNDN